MGLGLAALVRARGSPLIQGLERHQPGAREHADATASYAFATAVELGFERARAEAVREAARLHDVGKVYLPVEMLARAPDQLTPEEHQELDSHFERGAELARGAGIPDQVCEWIVAGRERFDGRGPGKLAGERIPIESRIVRVACTCHTILADTTPPADASAAERRGKAVEALRAGAGRELDPRVVEALVVVLDRAVADSGGT